MNLPGTNSLIAALDYGIAVVDVGQPGFDPGVMQRIRIVLQLYREAGINPNLL